MFVRWTRRHRASKDKPRYLLTAAIAESIRVDGKPRHKHIAYLGSIEEARISDPFARRRFRQEAANRMIPLKLDPAERKKLDAMLEARVPALTSKEDAQVRQDLTNLGVNP